LIADLAIVFHLGMVFKVVDVFTAVGNKVLTVGLGPPVGLISAIMNGLDGLNVGRKAHSVSVLVIATAAFAVGKQTGDDTILILFLGKIVVQAATLPVRR
jgi:hypothetical protein